MTVAVAPLECPCTGAHLATAFTYTSPPAGEVGFSFSTGRPYFREVLRCAACAHFVARHEMGGDELYAGEYVTSTYGDYGVTAAFERIIGLDPAKSDNVGRVRRILDFAQRHFDASRFSTRPPTVLDIGSGLCVFPYAMKAAGWDCTAVDPDPRAARHAIERVGVRGVCGDFMTVADLGRFDAVTFNKVLEHVQAPVAMLARVRSHVAADGFVYVELPDGETAATDGAERQEFAIAHWHAFSIESVAALARRAGFRTHTVERLREPSGKYTIRAFLRPDERATASEAPNRGSA